MQLLSLLLCEALKDKFGRADMVESIESSKK
jgi:hypothetical protein